MKTITLRFAIPEMFTEAVESIKEDLKDGSVTTDDITLEEVDSNNVIVTIIRDTSQPIDFEADGTNEPLYQEDTFGK
jgi:hypothetical protein